MAVQRPAAPRVVPQQALPVAAKPRPPAAKPGKRKRVHWHSSVNKGKAATATKVPRAPAGGIKLQRQWAQVGRIKPEQHIGEATLAEPGAENPFVGMHKRDMSAVRELIKSQGTAGGFDGDVVFIKTKRNPLYYSGFYFVRADSFQQLATSSAYNVPLWETLGPNAQCELLDPREPEGARRIAREVRKIDENTTFATKKNTSLETGLRACCRHAAEAAEEQWDACLFGAEALQRHVGYCKRRAVEGAGPVPVPAPAPAKAVELVQPEQRGQAAQVLQSCLAQRMRVL